MGRRVRIVLVALSALVGTMLSRNAIAQTLFSFFAPHVVRTPTAVLDPALGKQLDAEARATRLEAASDVVDLALKATARQLHFGLSHRTRLSFDANEREGNCVEYAELFASIVNREHGSVPAHAWVVRSDAKILGQTVPNPAWKDHDWVLVVTQVTRGPEGVERRYVDPTLYDMGLGWDIARAVQGEVRTP
jgi:hypothetical protein